MEVGCCSTGQVDKSVPSLVHIEGAQLRRYKPSRFNAHTTAEDGTLILYNSFSGHNCALPPSVAKRVRPYVSQLGYTGSLDALGEYLLKKGYIVEEHVDEGARWDVRYGLQQYRTDVLDLILLASEECNFRCIYCSQEFKRGTMLPAVREGIRNLVAARAPRLSVLRIAWFGGEPLLGYDAIAEIAPFCREIAKQYGVTYYSDITTNGYLLTPERSSSLLNWGITDYQITLDGAAADHDAHRPLKEGGHTFHTILDNLVAMSKHEQQFTVSLRTNFDNTNVDRLFPYLQSVREKLEGDPRFHIQFHAVGKWGGPNDDKLDVCGTKDIAGHLATLRSQARDLGLNPGEIAADLTPSGSTVCFAARPYSFVVGADGKLMKCTEVLDTEEANVVGNIAADGRMAIDEDRLAKWVRPYYSSDKMCNKCFFVPICQGVICSLPRVLGQDRPCPSPKNDIRQTLIEAWKEREQSRGARLVHIGNASS